MLRESGAHGTDRDVNRITAHFSSRPFYALIPRALIHIHTSLCIHFTPSLHMVTLVID